MLVGDKPPPARHSSPRSAAAATRSPAICGHCIARSRSARAAEPLDLWWRRRWTRRPRGRRAPARPVTVTVTPASGARVEGRLVRIDDFLVYAHSGRRHPANVRAEWSRTENRTEGSRRRLTGSSYRAGRQGHAQRYGLSLDDQVTMMKRCLIADAAARTDRAGRLSRPHGADSTRRRSSSHSASRGRPTPATTAADATARSRRSIRRPSRTWAWRGSHADSSRARVRRGAALAAPAAADAGAAAVPVAVGGCSARRSPAKAPASTTPADRHRFAGRSSWSTACCTRRRPTISGRSTRATARSSGSSTGRPAEARTPGIAASACGTTSSTWRRTTTTW